MDPFVFWKIAVSDIIDAIALVVTVWIAIVVQRNLTKNRFLKDYFINELKDLREEYRFFFIDLQNQKLNSKSIKAKLKILSLRIKTIEEYTTKCFSLEDSKLKDLHSNFQQFITGSKPYNMQYKSKSISFPDTITTQILKHQNNIVGELTRRVICINSATRRYRYWFIRNKS